MASSTQSAEANLRKNAVLFFQEVACLQRPWMTAAWAASLHLVWYYLSFSSSGILSKCCAAAMVALAADYAIQWYHKRSQRVRALLPPLLAQTIRREHGVNSPSVVPHLLAPRSYAQLCELVDQTKSVCTAARDQLLEWRNQHTDLFSGCAAAACFLLGVVFNRLSSAFLLYIIVLIVLLLPILERLPEARALCAQLQPDRIASFLAANAMAAPQHEEEVMHLAERLPSVETVLRTPLATHEREEEDSIRADLVQYFQEEDTIEQVQAARLQRVASRASSSATSVLNATAAAATTAAAAANPEPIRPAQADVVQPEHVATATTAQDALGTSTLRRRNTAGARDEFEEDGFALVSHSEAN